MCSWGEGAPAPPPTPDCSQCHALSRCLATVPVSHRGPRVSQQDRQGGSQAVGAVGEEASALFDDWQREVEPEEAELLEDEGPRVGPDFRGVDVRQEAPERRKEKDGRRRADMGLPFLTGVSPAGFLSANRKQPGETDHVVKVTIGCFLSRSNPSAGVSNPECAVVSALR